MKRTPLFRRAAAMLAAVPLIWLVPYTALGQDLEFDPDEELLDTTDLEFPEEDAPIIDSDDLQVRTTGLIIPGEHLDSRTAVIISDLILEALHNIPDVQPVDYLDLQDEFDIMGAELALECAFDPVCLGRVAADVGLDEVIIGRATGRTGSELQLVLDRVDTERRSIIRYRPVRVDTDEASLRVMVERQLPFLYGLQTPETRPPIEVREGPSPLQTGLAWTSLGLGVAALATGIYFGVQAANAESDVRGATLLENGALDITQVDADRRLAEGEDDALLANVMLGTGIALLGVSLLLFLITPGGDIDVEADRQFVYGGGGPQVGPQVSGEGWGLFGRIPF